MGEIDTMFDFCAVDGLLIVDGEGYWTRLPSVALVTDCAAWRRAHQEDTETAATERDADRAHSVVQEKGTDSKALLRRLGARLEGAQESQAPLQIEIAMALCRLNLPPLQVTRQSLNAYLCHLLEQVSEGVEKDTFRPAFLFNADLPTPTLWGTDSVDLALRFCSLDLLSVRESALTLKLRVTAALLGLDSSSSLDPDWRQHDEEYR